MSKHRLIPSAALFCAVLNLSAQSIAEPVGRVVGQDPPMMQGGPAKSAVPAGAGNAGLFVPDLIPGQNQRTAEVEGFAGATPTVVDPADPQNANPQAPQATSPVGGGSNDAAAGNAAGANPNFFKRLGKAYWDDWHSRPDD